MFCLNWHIKRLRTFCVVVWYDFFVFLRLVIKSGYFDLRIQENGNCILFLWLCKLFCQVPLEVQMVFTLSLMRSAESSFGFRNMTKLLEACRKDEVELRVRVDSLNWHELHDPLKWRRYQAVKQDRVVRIILFKSQHGPIIYTLNRFQNCSGQNVFSVYCVERRLFNCVYWVPHTSTAICICNQWNQQHLELNQHVLFQCITWHVCALV